MQGAARKSRFSMRMAPGALRAAAAAKSDHSHVWRRYRLLLLGSNRPKTLSLRNPRRSVSVGRETACFLGKFAKACDPDFVSVSVLDYLVYCVIHRGGSFWHGTEGQDITWCRHAIIPQPQPRTRTIRRKKRLMQFNLDSLGRPI